MENQDGVEPLAATALLHRQGVSPHGADEAGGSGRRSSHPARRWTMKVVYPCFET
jgi:hypothetical protein